MSKHNHQRQAEEANQYTRLEPGHAPCPVKGLHRLEREQRADSNRQQMLRRVYDSTQQDGAALRFRGREHDLKKPPRMGHIRRPKEYPAYGDNDEGDAYLQRTRQEGLNSLFAQEAFNC